MKIIFYYEKFSAIKIIFCSDKEDYAFHSLVEFIDNRKHNKNDEEIKNFIHLH